MKGQVKVAKKKHSTKRAAPRGASGDEQAGDFASSIMMTLGYEWI